MQDIFILHGYDLYSLTFVSPSDRGFEVNLKCFNESIKNRKSFYKTPVSIIVTGVLFISNLVISLMQF